MQQVVVKRGRGGARIIIQSIQMSTAVVPAGLGHEPRTPYRM